MIKCMIRQINHVYGTLFTAYIKKMDFYVIQNPCMLQNINSLKLKRLKILILLLVQKFYNESNELY